MSVIICSNDIISDSLVLMTSVKWAFLNVNGWRWIAVSQARVD